jgi:MoxR-like ATPase
MFNVVIRYLSEDDEVRVVTQTTGDESEALARVLDGDEILAAQRLVRRVPVAEEVARYAVRLVDASRPGQPHTPDFVGKWVKWGASLRASQALVLGGKARALMQGRYHVSVADVRALAPAVLRHRIVTNFYAESDEVDADEVVARLLETVPAPASGL